MIHCPHCQSKIINKNGKKGNNKQNYLCRTCGKQSGGVLFKLSIKIKVVTL
jgi:transposase-like protein